MLCKALDECLVYNFMNFCQVIQSCYFYYCHSSISPDRYVYSYNAKESKETSDNLWKSVLDVDGKQVSVDGLRNCFTTCMMQQQKAMLGCIAQPIPVNIGLKWQVYLKAKVDDQRWKIRRA